MTGAWYWYLEAHDYGHGGYVRIHAEKPGYVVGNYWVIPVKDDHYNRWNIYLQPRWLVDHDPSLRVTEHPFDCEWVFVKRVKWAPPPKEDTRHTVDVCECCGQEVWR